ncbi:nicotinamide riboside transporter PnuC [Liquorilactobacillus mali]|uniref:Nicotinamide mononucleotide transporter n=1 Tax=Liquorilactobacillus mali KCTC 3596 = DSM 20444 TaxID=1046596 RepID=A0A0R2DZK0_9LACO|nr:nicotinamide riboside transporter PnuC [Liquorilactobacillus mali]KRN09362.1 nicotinamide mononucleotide transporter [Liquorilactobacillus mali KCTC 3596 = DSM 20444]
MENLTGRFEGNYFGWIKEQLVSVPKSMWTMWGFGAGMETILFLTGQIQFITFMALLGTLFGMACVCSMASGHPINGMLGAVSVIAYITVNLPAHHYFSVLDQLFFLFLIDIPLMLKWRTWGRGDNSEIKNLIDVDSLKNTFSTGESKFGKKILSIIKNIFKAFWKYLLVIIAVLALWFALYHIGHLRIMNDYNVYWDSLALAIGAVASVLCFTRYTQTYTLWLVSDAVNIALWFYALKDGYSQAALPMLAMTLFYTASAVYGRFFAIWNGKKQK